MILHRALSKGLQSDAALILDLPRMLDNYKQSLQKFAHTLGAEAERRLESLKKGLLVMADGDAKNDERKLVIDDEEVGTYSLNQAMGDIKTRILAYQSEIVDKMMTKVPSRLGCPRVAELLQEILDFRRMPLNNMNLLYNWSDDAIEELAKKYFPEFDLFVLKDEALAMRWFVAQNNERFVVDGRLLLTGPGGIFPALFSRKDVCTKEIPHILHIADYMIAFMWQSCNGERAGSHINLVKSKGRTLLGDESFDDLVFNTMNLPELHEIDFTPIVKRWLDDDRKSASFVRETTKGEEPRSKVIQRHHAKTTSTFLYK